MLLSTTFFLLAAIFPAVSVLAQDYNIATQTIATFITIASDAATSSSSSSVVEPDLIPPFGITQGILLNDGTPRCAGLDNKPIDCDCPPDFDTFLNSVDTTVASGAAFPAGDSTEDQLQRLQTCIEVLQNIKGGPGTGIGCPVVSTNWSELQNQLTSAINGQ